MENSDLNVENQFSIDAFAIILSALRKRTRLIFIALILFSIIGIIVSSLIKKEYTANATILPQADISNSISSRYSSIAVLAGLNISGQDGSKLTPKLYPVFLDNLYFQRKLYNKTIRLSTISDSISYGDFMLNYYDEGSLVRFKSNIFGLPSKIISLFKNKNNNLSVIDTVGVNRRTVNEIFQEKILKKQLKVIINEEQGVMIIEAITHDPLLSEQLVRRCEEVLQKTIIDGTIEKSKIELEFLEKRLKVAKEDYIAKRSALGNFRDRNKFALTSYTKNIEEQLNSEYQLTFSVYSQIATQIENAKLQIAKDTPIFTVIKPAVVPVGSSSTSSAVIVLGVAFSGVFVVILIILFFAFKPFLMGLLKSKMEPEDKE